MNSTGYLCCQIGHLFSILKFFSLSYFEYSCLSNILFNSSNSNTVMTSTPAHNQLRLICILLWSPWSSWVSLFISVLKRKVVGNIPRHTASHRKKPARLYRTTMQGRSNCKNTAGQFLGHRLYSTLMFIHKVC